jgi:molybdopterin/thiamine biosynthesis adenylyltransferase
VTFDYSAAFSRNLGLMNQEEQERFRDSRVAIAGMGAVGGAHLLTLARMGIGAFHLADFDTYELVNFNRQAGATISTLGKKKTAVMEQMALDVNPNAAIEGFDQGITSDNIDDFLYGVDIAIDGLDFFATEARDVFYRAAHEKSIPVVAAGPIGCSAALLVFLPGGMTWQRYFSMELAKDDLDRYILFAIGTAPAATHMSYIDRRYVDLAGKKGPSLALGIQLCAGVTAAEVMKILLGRGKVYAVPYYQQFDAYRCTYIRGRLLWGNRGPIQRLKKEIFRRTLSK